MKIQFLGAAGTVTGSKFLLTIGKSRILIDCGLFQGLKPLRRLNWSPPPVDPASVDAIILTHAHLDHCGYLPVFVRNGFRGPILCTPPTRDLARLILMDSAKLQEEDAALANRLGFSKHKPALPLYTRADVRRTLKQFHTIRDHLWYELRPGLRFQFLLAGHILGAASVLLESRHFRIVFSGDIGRYHSLLMDPPQTPETADVVVMESTYGDRLHPQEPVEDMLAQIIQQTWDRRGALLIPAFAVGRTQEILYLLWKLRRDKRIPRMPVYLDSPMGQAATKILLQYPGWHRLPPDTATRMVQAVHLVRSMRESRSLQRSPHRKIIIAGSGMLEGGRILGYLKHALGDARSTLLFVGYQAEGTRGRQLLHGSREIKIHGKYYPVHLTVHHLSSLSAHADQAELLQWLGSFHHLPDKIFLVHGEPHAADVLRVRIHDRFDIEPAVPALLETVRLPAVSART